MRTTTRHSLIAGAALAIGLGLASPASAADATWTVTGANADGSANAVSTNTTLTVPRSTASLQCAVAEAAATINNVTGHSGTGAGTIGGTTWTDCTGPFSLVFAVNHAGTWSLNAVEPTSDPNVNKISITGISASINGPGCTATFTGSVSGHYDNGSGTLTLDPADLTTDALTASGVSGCFGIIQNGDLAEFRGDFEVDPNTIDLTSVA